MKYILIENYDKSDFYELWVVNTIDIDAKGVAKVLMFRGIHFDQIHTMPCFDDIKVELPDRTRIKWVTPDEEKEYKSISNLFDMQIGNYPKVMERLKQTVH